MFRFEIVECPVGVYVHVAESDWSGPLDSRWVACAWTERHRKEFDHPWKRGVVSFLLLV